MKRTNVIFEKDAKTGQWRLVINLGRVKRAALPLARKIVARLAPSELLPRRLDGTFDKDGRETYKNDPRKSRG